MPQHHAAAFCDTEGEPQHNDAYKVVALPGLPRAATLRFYYYRRQMIIKPWRGETRFYTPNTYCLARDLLDVIKHAAI